MRTRQFSRILVLGLLAGVLCACTLSPKQADTQMASDELLAQQLATVERALAQAPAGERTVLYLGSAQHSQSLAFQRDVLLVQKQLQAVNPRLQSIILSNEMRTSRLVYPFATLHTLTQAFDRIASWSKKYPLTVVVLVTTHGHVDILSSNVANEPYTPIQTRHLRLWLDALGRTPSALILSSCYSGSFLPALAAADRIVLTAAAANRNSFGCNYESDNTHFVGELFGTGFDPAKTWQQNFDRTRHGIEKKEVAMGLAPSSNPQHSVPKALADRSVADFLRP